VLWGVGRVGHVLGGGGEKGGGWGGLRYLEPPIGLRVLNGPPVAGSVSAAVRVVVPCSAALVVELRRTFSKRQHL
jgi:hypothetical protein